MLRTEFKVRKGNRIYKYPVTMRIDENRIWFTKSPFALKDEIKAMKGPKWHGFEDPPIKVWSVKNCPRNAFQIRALMGEDVYAHFDQPLIEHDLSERGYLTHQADMINKALTYRYQIFAAEQGLGKSLVAIATAEHAGGTWWYIGPKSATESFYLELEKWKSTANFQQFFTYEALQRHLKYDDYEVPDGIIVDESQAVKNPASNRAIAVQFIADKIREKEDSYVILLSGTPTAKLPSDIWSQAEITWPGFLREGSLHAFQQRYCEMVQETDADGVTFNKIAGWREDEVAELPNRLKGLQSTYRKVDWLDLPPKKFRRRYLEPSKKVTRVAASLAKVAPNAITALTWLRALSSGFQYVLEDKDKIPCAVCESEGCSICNWTGERATKERVTKVVDTPKVAALKEEIADFHRVIVMASFKGSIDRCWEIAKELGYATCVVDGAGWRSYTKDGQKLEDHPMRFWKECPDPVCFVGNPASCRLGLTLIEAKRMVFWDNSFSAEHRLQAIDRFHRIGTTESPEVVDLIHLPVDQRVVDVLDENRSLELISLGAIRELVGEPGDEE